MKALIFAIVALSALSVSATVIETPEYYTPEFTVTRVSPMCPRNLPQGAVCMGLGSIVHVQATLGGCLDTLEFFDSKSIQTGPEVELHIVSVAYRNPESARVRCARANTVYKTIPVNEMGRITVINSVIQN